VRPKEIARRLEVRVDTVRKWRKRFFDDPVLVEPSPGWFVLCRQGLARVAQSRFRVFS
jgi:transposase-like protein